MPRLSRGLYEDLITAALEASLREVGDQHEVLRGPLRPGEAADRVALQLARVIRRTLEGKPDRERVAVGIALARSLLAELHSNDEAPIEPGALLRAVAARLPDGRTEDISSPL